MCFDHSACVNVELDGEIHCSICLGFHNKSQPANQADVLKDYFIIKLTHVNSFWGQTGTTLFEDDLDTFVVRSLICMEMSDSSE